jgi:N-acylmannosamine kinase|tara:strand:+ start:637 stop:1524 length:888 start_codon:yes stop_codon:yes gene_type:complete
MIFTIDIGGTKIAAALFSNDGEIIEKAEVASCIHEDFQSLPGLIYNSFWHLASKASVVGVASTGIVQADAVNYLSVGQSLPLQSVLEKQFNKPVFILNDASAAALAEFKALSQKRSIESNTFVYITVSTGIGGGVIQNGTLITSENGFCAHLGHVTIPTLKGNIFQCHCGRVNCAESVGSGNAIGKLATEKFGFPVSAKQLFTRHLNTQIGQSIIDEAAHAVAQLTATAKAITGTQIVTLGGSVGVSPIFSQKVKNAVKSLPEIFHVDVVSPEYSRDADLYGAYFFAKDSAKEIM